MATEVRARGAVMEAAGAPSLDPARRIWLAVVLQALADCRGKMPLLRAEALRWLSDPALTVGSCRWLMAELDLDGRLLAQIQLRGRRSCRYQRPLGMAGARCQFCGASVTDDRLYCDPRCRKREEWRRRRQRRRAAA